MTGAAGGLGRAVSRMLAQRGSTVFLVDMDRQGVEAHADALRREGLSAIAAVVDLGNDEELPALRSAIEKHGDGRLDVLSTMPAAGATAPPARSP